MALVADKATCTTAGVGGTTPTSCKIVTSCCALISASSGGDKTTGDAMICLPAGSITSVAVITPDTITGIDNFKCYPVADCPAATAGASTLAVSAAALATAVYMM